MRKHGIDRELWILKVQDDRKPKKYPTLSLHKNVRVLVNHRMCVAHTSVFSTDGCSPLHSSLPYLVLYWPFGGGRVFDSNEPHAASFPAPSNELPGKAGSAIFGVGSYPEKDVEGWLRRMCILRYDFYPARSNGRRNASPLSITLLSLAPAAVDVCIVERQQGNTRHTRRKGS